jgi:oleate hydratase
MRQREEHLGEKGTTGNEAHRQDVKAYLIGGGIASLAAAAFLIRDGDMPGHRITIFEELDRMGGSLDAGGSAEEGYVLRGGRMFESKYLCTFDLFSSIPTLDDRQTVTEEIQQWNKTLRTSSKARLFRNGERQTAPKFGLSEAHIVRLEVLAIEPELALGASRIDDHFDESFFATDFWIMWCTTFAFQPWHSAVEFKRYLRRFSHMVKGFNRLEGIMRTVFNQFDSMVRPLERWLMQHGVIFKSKTQVTSLGMLEEGGRKTIELISTLHDGRDEDVAVRPWDLVLVTLGSMTEGSTQGSMLHAPLQQSDNVGSAIKLWTRLAWGRPEFGRPETFFGDVEHSRWISFTTTLRDPSLLDLIMTLTGNVPGEGGLITFPDSNWLMSIVVPHQPHVLHQPDGIGVFWGYGLKIDMPGNFIDKPMTACSGAEIMTEVLGHLGRDIEPEVLSEHLVCIPCLLPFITSQFMPRAAGDRPAVVPRGSVNLGLMGQFCEIPEDVVFTVEYSIRSAQLAVYQLLGLGRKPPAVYHGMTEPQVLLDAFRALHDMAQ